MCRLTSDNGVPLLMADSHGPPVRMSTPLIPSGHEDPSDAVSARC